MNDRTGYSRMEKRKRLERNRITAHLKAGQKLTTSKTSPDVAAARTRLEINV
ncbi:hypothetical protein [Paraburkholderia sp.]|jgi:hypothetical protein|uniref:hypothetical protein n=1 Tax=Paraburkholderia sp. TaxID=1926495 RepID=UPI002F40DBB9